MLAHVAMGTMVISLILIGKVVSEVVYKQPNFG